MIRELKESALQANLKLHESGLAIFSFGNVSVIDRSAGYVVIKPSGIPYEEMAPTDMVVLDLDGKIIEGKLKPSSDTPTHLVLYQHFTEIGCIIHTHSEWATSWAQAGRDIPCYGTTHADSFYGSIPCTRKMKQEEVENEYEKNTGEVIVERFREIDYTRIPAVLIHGHGPFIWGKDAGEAMENAVYLELLAKMAFRNEVLGNKTPIDQTLLDKHFFRKHGKTAYYGQK